MKMLVCCIAVILALGVGRAPAQERPPGDTGDGRPPRSGWGPGGAWAQNPPPRPERGDRERRPESPGAPGLGRVMEEVFFPPELVMRNQRAIGLRDDQQEAIRADMHKAVARFTDLQWQQSAQVEAIEALCRRQPVDEKAVLAQFDKLLSIEGEVKRLHLASLIRVKNILSPEQQAQLRELDRQGRPGPDDPPRRPGGVPPGAPDR